MGSHPKWDTGSAALKRRALLRAAIAGGVLTTLPAALASAAQATTNSSEGESNPASGDPWLRAHAIAARFATPLAFPTQDFLVTKYGARPCKLVDVQGQVASLVPGTLQTPAKGSHDCYPAVTAAIAAAHNAGGGRVIIPEGAWYIKGPLVLRSNVHVHLAKGARLVFSANPDDYARYGDIDCGKNGKLVRSRWQGNDCLNFSPLVYAHGQTNIALTGEDWTSILDGQGGVPFENNPGECWWDWKGRGKPARERTEVAPNPNNAPLARRAPHIGPEERALIEGPGNRWQTDSRYLPALSEAGIAAKERIFGHGHFLRPCMVELIECENVLLQGYHIVGAPFWLHHPVASRNVHFKDVNMESLGPNSDGFDPEACDGVLVEGCTFNNGDDCIAIKAGKNKDTHYGPTRNILIRNCVMNSGHGGVTLGSEMAGGIEHVYAEQIEFRNVHWASDALNTAIRLKTNMNRGGFLRHLYVRNCTLPNGVQTSPGFYKPLPGTTKPSGQVASGAGAVITVDCDYAPADDAVRTRPPQVSDIEISGLKVGNVNTAQGKASCYQVMVLLGPVASSYNGAAGAAIPPITRVTIRDCDFGTPRNSKQPWFLHNVRGLVFDNVTIGGQRYSGDFSADA
jgi:polygalacturonase